MPEPNIEAALHFWAETFRKALTDALSQGLKANCTVSVTTDSTPAADKESISFVVAAGGAAKGSAAIQLKKSDALLLAQKLRGESADPAAEFKAEHQQVIEGFVGKVAQLVVAASKAQFGEFTFEVKNGTPAGEGTNVLLSVSQPATGPLSLWLQLDTELLSNVPIEPQPAAEIHAAPEPAKPMTTGDSNLDLLLGVDLSVTLRFGQRTLTLREIMDLSSGSIIELDRQVQEPADLLLGDKLIARGEVVIVDGNYGLRITEVADPQATADRMATAAGR